MEVFWFFFLNYIVIEAKSNHVQTCLLKYYVTVQSTIIQQIRSFYKKSSLNPFAKQATFAI